MNRILSIYSTKAYKAYLLPSINNSDYSIIINKDIFCLDKDIELELEIIEDRWSFLPSDQYKITDVVTKENYEGNELRESVILSVSLPQNMNLSVMYEETDVTFSIFEKFSLSGIEQITIGREENNDISFDNRGLVSAEHAIINKKGDQWILEDKSSNGTFVNDRRVVGQCQLYFGDRISIFGLTLVFLDDMLAVNTCTKRISVNNENLIPVKLEKKTDEWQEARYKRSKAVFHRSPRQIHRLETEPVEIEEPPQARVNDKKPIALVIGPSMTMALPMLLGCGLAIYGSNLNGTGSSAFMYTGLVTAISSAFVGTIWAVVNLIQEKKRNKKEEIQRFEAYSQYLIKMSNIIKEKYEKNKNSLISMYRPSNECCEQDMNSMTLWSRNPEQEDFLSCRLGIGNMPFQVPINIPKEKFKLYSDSLAEKPAMIKESYKMLHDVPLCVDLNQHRIVGIVSKDGKKGAIDIMHSMVAQIAASNCYTDVKMAFVFDEGEDDTQDWHYFKWLPHVWSEDKQVRFYANNKNAAGDILYELTRILRDRADNRKNMVVTNKNKITCPQYILFIANPDMLEGDLLTKYLYAEDNCDAVTIILSDSFENLPNKCDFIIENDSSFKGMYTTDTEEENKTAVDFDLIGNAQLEAFSRRLSDIEVSELESGGDIPSSLTFFDMYGINEPGELNVLEKWRKNRTYDSMKALIGQRAAGAPWYLDIHEKYHGPHGLIAGTTGSGKSETLQTYILSMATNFSPDDVGFFIIDYKGGGMANLFNNLPHMIGQISNLSGNQVKRAMVSIKSENRRRQRIFNEYGVNNINLYTRLYKNKEASVPIPHLFIIIDEFAELKREEPDFMKELISVAQVGRSLGVHLILATQKPSGTVDDNIWSNSKFRLCLRVQDKQDSNDMLHKPDAAYITQAGRCYMQVGNDEIFELFQSGYSGAVYDEELGSAQSEIATMISDTGRTALVGNRNRLKQKEIIKHNWIAGLVKAVSETGIVPGEEQGIFEYLEKHGIEYPYSEYNLMRIRDLLRVLEKVREISSDVTTDKAIDALIAIAEKNKIKLPEKKEKTQLDAVVEYLDDIARKNGYTHDLQLWLPVLPEYIPLSDLDGYKADEYFDGKKWNIKESERSISIPIGIYDDPANQYQGTVSMNITENGHHAVVGSVTSGKSTFIQTIMYSLIMKYTPYMVNIYAIDFSAKMAAAFEQAPHVGGVMFENDEEKIAKFFNMMGDIFNERKEQFRGGNYNQYIRTHGLTKAAIIICIDNYYNFRARTENRYDEFIQQLSKDGLNYGIYLIISGGGISSTDIPMRVAENIRTVMSLELSDKFQYMEVLHTMRLDTMPETNIKGRGLVKIEDDILEYQVAVALAEKDDFRRMEQIEATVAQMKEAWKGEGARPIPCIPENPVWSEYSALEDVKKMSKDDRHLPIGYNAETAGIYGIDLSRTYCYLITGKSRTGKTNMLRIICNSALLRSKDVTVIDFGGDLRQLVVQNGLDLIDSDKKLFDYLLKLKPDFVERNIRKKSDEQNGMSDIEIYSDMRCFTEKYILIANLSDFVAHVMRPEGTEPMHGFVENILDKGALHNVYWFACLNNDDLGLVYGERIYELYTRSVSGIHMGGNVAGQRIFNFDSVPFAEQGRTLKAGIGLLPDSNGDEVRKVVIPLNG